MLLLGLVSMAASLSPPPNANCDITQADVDAARQEGYEAGYEAGQSGGPPSVSPSPPPSSVSPSPSPPFASPSPPLSAPPWLPTTPPPSPIPTTYEEGFITNAEYPKNWYDSEAAVQTACSSDVDCKGYWQRSSGHYFILKAGFRTFSAGVPHFTVLVVKVKKNAAAPATPPAPSPVSTSPPSPSPPPPPSPSPPQQQPQPQPPSPSPPLPSPTPSSTPAPTPAPTPDAPPQYQKLNYRKPSCPAEFEITSQEECSRAITSLGVTAFDTWTGSRAGMPRFCALQKDTNEMIWNEVAEGIGRHDLAPVCKYTGTPTPPEPTPAPVPDSRDNVTVTPEEWDYFLAFQESRARGFSCRCNVGTLGSDSCNEIEGAVKHFHAPNPEKATFDCTLWKAAYWHAEDQAIQNYCGHNAKDGMSPRQRAERVGAIGPWEHIACAGSRHSQGPAALRGLQTSAGHCNSMFDLRFRGFAVGHSSGDKDVWTVMYNRGGDDISDSESCIPDGYTATGDLK